MESVYGVMETIDCVVAWPVAPTGRTEIRIFRQRRYQYIIDELQSGRPLRVMVQASAGYIRRHCALIYPSSL